MKPKTNPGNPLPFHSLVHNVPTYSPSFFYLSESYVCFMYNIQGFLVVLGGISKNGQSTFIAKIITMCCIIRRKCMSKMYDKMYV